MTLAEWRTVSYSDARILPHADLTHAIIGAFYDVYNALGSGFREVVYQRALALALEDRGPITVQQACRCLSAHPPLVRHQVERDPRTAVVRGP